MLSILIPLPNVNGPFIGRMVIWSFNWRCVVPLCILIVGQWAFVLPACETRVLSIINHHVYLFILAVLAHGFWVPDYGCDEPRHALFRVNSASYIYVILVDFTGLCLCAWELAEGMKMKLRLSRFIFGDGMGYFTIMQVAYYLLCVFRD